MTMPSQTPAAPKRRLIDRLLYGQGVDREAKSRARVGLVILGFACIFTVISVRLVYLAAISDGQGAKRTGGDIVATARPDILDRNGEVLATDVRMPSLFGEPRRIIDVDEAVELLTATMPDMNATELRERLSSKKGFV